VDRPLRIGTRKSQLAMRQTRWVTERLVTLQPGLRVEIQGVISAGDQIQDRPLPEIGGKGLFTQELDQALLAGQIDLAVHSLKDLPTALTSGLALGAVPEREDPRDVFIGKGGMRFDQLPAGAVVGTSSLRRRALVLHARPDITVTDLRGNVDTRLRKVQESGALQGAVLALAGLRRLGRFDESTMEILDIAHWVPMVAQGALGVVTRVDDPDVLAAVRSLEHPPTRAAVTAERALLARLEGGCHIPIGAHAQSSGESLRLTCLIADPDGARLVREEIAGPTGDAESLGVAAAERLLANGGAAILADLRDIAKEKV
jgi:hydroxymethylbilane synthase